MKSVLALMFLVAMLVCVLALIVAVWNLVVLLRHVQPGVEQRLNPIHYIIDPTDLTQSGIAARRRVIVWGGVFFVIVTTAFVVARAMRQATP